jgi:hypothetical protein
MVQFKKLFNYHSTLFNLENVTRDIYLQFQMVITLLLIEIMTKFKNHNVTLFLSAWGGANILGTRFWLQKRDTSTKMRPKVIPAPGSTSGVRTRNLKVSFLCFQAYSYNAYHNTHHII